MPFEVLNQNDYILIKAQGDCNGDETPKLSEELSKMVNETKIKHAVILAQECSSMAPSFLKELTSGYKSIKALNGSMRVVAPNHTVKNCIVQNGLDRILVPKMSLRGALIDFGLVKKKEFDVNVINPFLNGTIKVLKIQCFLEGKAGTPYLKKPTDPLLLGDVSGIISIASESFSGTLAISMNEDIFKKIAENMLGEPCAGITEENVDLVGELANMILGQAKIDLSQSGYGIQMALPSCVWGKDHKIKHFGGGTCMVLPFETEAGTIYSEIMTVNSTLQNLTQKKSA